jgi:ATP-binding protein involved in chromosome partitioning
MEGREIISINVDLSCDRFCESCEKFFECENPEKEKMFIRRRMGKAKDTMSRIKYKIAVVGGKGGVGKSITTVNLSTALAMRGRKVSILDQDFDGATVPKMLGVMDKRLTLSDEGIIPVEGTLGIQVISTGNILRDDEVLTWFHDMRRNATEEFLSHVVYGERDYLLIDLPPGTSSDSVNMMEYIPDLTGAVIVTVPSEVSQNVAKKASLLCRKAKVKIFGVIENMGGFVCPECGSTVNILRYGGGEKLAKELDVPFLGRIPLDPRLSICSDEGKPFVLAHPESPASKEVMKIAETLENMVVGSN